MFDIYLFCDWHQGTSPTGYFYMRFLISQNFFALKCKFKNFFLNVYLESMFRSFFMLNKSLTKAQIFNHCEDFI